MSTFAAIVPDAGILFMGSNMQIRDGSNRAVFSRVALAIALWPAVHGCDAVNGGAAELSWKLRPASSSLPDKFVECDSGKPNTGAVTIIRLEWLEGDAATHEEWPCDDSHGVTGFALPPGPTQFVVIPLCGPDMPADPSSYTAPAPEIRNVNAGDTVSLGAVEIIVNVSYCDRQPCICQ
jgi:hypothetical protein